jgi:hypothetical protein
VSLTGWDILRLLLQLQGLLVNIVGAVREDLAGSTGREV